MNLKSLTPVYFIKPNTCPTISWVTQSGAECDSKESARLLTELSRKGPTGGAKRCHYQQSVDDAGRSPRVLADFAHWDQILRSALVSLRRSSFLQKAGLFGDHYSRTRKLSPVVPKIVPWRRSVIIGDTRITMPTSDSKYFFMFSFLWFCVP